MRHTKEGDDMDDSKIIELFYERSEQAIVGFCSNACARSMSRIGILRADPNRIDFRCSFRYPLCFGIPLE